MQYRSLGRSGLQVSVISLGSWYTFGETVDDAATDACMRAGYDAGINFFDGAEIYAAGEAERAMGRVIKSAGWGRDTFVVSSKVWHIGNKPTQRGLSRKHLVEACDAACRRMGLEYLDILFCHRPDPLTPLEEIVLTMNELIARGRIFYWGTSEFSQADLMQMWAIAERRGLIGPAVEQTNHSMLGRGRVERELVPLFRRYGMGSTIYSPLAQGLLTGKYNDGVPPDSRLGATKHDWMKGQLTEENVGKVRKLTALATELGISTAHLALAWCLKNPDVSTAIIGATRPKQVEENAAAVEHLEKLDAGVMERIEQILGNRPR